MFFFFNVPATTEIYTYRHTLSLHDALPICPRPITPPPTAAPMALPRLKAPILTAEARLGASDAASITRIWSGGTMAKVATPQRKIVRSEEHTSELQSLMRISYAVFCLKKTRQKK